MGMCLDVFAEMKVDDVDINFEINADECPQTMTKKKSILIKTRASSAFVIAGLNTGTRARGKKAFIPPPMQTYDSCIFSEDEMDSPLFMKGKRVTFGARRSEFMSKPDLSGVIHEEKEWVE